MKTIKDEFDTSILGHDVYKITLDDKTTGAEIEEGVQAIHKGIVFCFTPLVSQNVTTLEKLQFHFMSIRSTYKFVGPVPRVDPLPAGYSIAPFVSSDIISDSDIYDLAHPIYVFSRYYKDTRIPKNKSMELYIQWVNNCLYKGYAQQCFLTWHQGKPIGICTVKIKDGKGFIDLLGVLSDYQDKTIGKQLVVRSLDYLKSRKIDNISVVTEAENIKANIFYQKNNFVIQGIALVYHKHV